MEVLVVTIVAIVVAATYLSIGYQEGKRKGYKEGLESGYRIGKGTDNILNCKGCKFETEDDEPGCVVCSRAYSDCYRKKG